MRIYKRRRPNGSLESPFWWAEFPDPRTSEKVRFSTKRRIDGGKEAKNAAKAYATKKESERFDAVQFNQLPTKTLKEVLEAYQDTTTHLEDHRNIKARVDKLLGRGIHKVTGEVRPGLSKSMDTPFHEISNSDVYKLRTIRLDEGNAHNTINYELGTLGAAITHARKVIKCKAPEDLELPKFKVQGRLRYFSREEVERILAELDPKRHIPGWAAYGDRPTEIQRAMDDAYDLAVALCDTGCRTGEISEIQWSVMDTVGWTTINIYRSKVGNEGELVMTNRLREVMQRRWMIYGNQPYVFPGRNGGPRKSTSTGAIRRAIERAGCNAEHIVSEFGRSDARTFRDTFGSWLVINGLSLYKLQMLLGHSSPEMTQKYAHLVPSQAAQEATSILDSLHAA